MRQRPVESDQLMIAIDGCIPPLARKLNDMGIGNFEELYRFGVQKEGDVAQEKKHFSGRSGNKEGPSSNVQINAIDRPRKFSNLGRPLSKVLEKLTEKGLLRPLSPRIPVPNADPKLFCKYHQMIGHDTDQCTRLKYDIQDLIDSGKLVDPETRKPNTQTNHLPNY